ncbi:MAG: pyridoxal phosphate-dependent aminotransferase, partial [Pyrinomonadaceae bacterium]
MAFPVSESVKRMRPSATLAAAAIAADLKSQGADVIDLSIGEPDFDTPQHIKNYAIEALQHGITKYTPTTGLKSLQKAIIGFYEREFGVSFAANQVMATSGGKQAIFNAVLTLVNRDDEVLIHQPYWVSFPEIVNFTGAKIVEIETEETGFVLTAEQVKVAITDKTKLIIINSPGNPSGRVIPADEFRKIVEVCAEHNVYVVSDECYLKFVYPPAEVFSTASLPKELQEYVCIAGTFSKTLAMTGWRVGYTIANPEWTRGMAKLQSHSTSHPTSFAQEGCAMALENWSETNAALNRMLAEYTRRREFLIPALNEIGLPCEMPEGAFYAFPNVRRCFNERIKTSADFADLLLKEAHIVTTNGAGFGVEGFIRLSYA